MPERQEEGKRGGGLGKANNLVEDPEQLNDADVSSPFLHSKHQPSCWRSASLFLLGFVAVLAILLLVLTLLKQKRYDQPSQPIYKYHITRSQIPMTDGVLLDVTYATPIPIEGSSETKFPVLLEYLPYRKDDSFYTRDRQYLSFFAKRGYIVAEVDVRGTGSSFGVLPTEEYSEQELLDGEVVIEYLATNLTLSNGNVGMFGISWGGFNGLMLAFRSAGKTHLKTIVSVDASEDLYANDIHYIDGVMHQDEYIASMCHENALPQLIINGDLDRLLNPLDDYYPTRFEQDPWIFTYVRHQLNSTFWSNHSVMYQYDKLQIPVYLIGGLYDGYKDFVLNIQQGVKNRVPSNNPPFIKAVIGPWEHSWPDDSAIGPDYDGRGEAVRWFDYWLKGKHTSVLDEPDLAVFIREPNLPTLDVGDNGINGTFQFVDYWPLGQPKILYPSKDHSLAVVPPASNGEDNFHQLIYNATVGAEAGTWWGDLTPDQAPLDQYCLVYDFPVLSEDQEMIVIGFANVSLRTSINATANANWIVRLEDVYPNGSVSLVTGALLNGAERESRTTPSLLEEDEVYVLKFRLHFTTWTFKKGHSLRISVSNALFRVIWPSATPLTMKLYVDDPDTWVQLPVMEPSFQIRDDKIPEFTKIPSVYEADASPPDAVDYDIGGYPMTLTNVWDEETQSQRVYWVGDSWWNIKNVLITAFLSHRFEANRLSPEISSWSFCATQTYVYGVPLSEKIEERFDFNNYPATNESNWCDEPFLEAKSTLSVGLPVFQLVTNFTLTADLQNFYMVLNRSIYVNNTLVRHKEFQDLVPRTFQ